MITPDQRAAADKVWNSVNNKSLMTAPSAYSGMKNSDAIQSLFGGAPKPGTTTPAKPSYNPATDAGGNPRLDLQFAKRGEDLKSAVTDTAKITSDTNNSLVKRTGAVLGGLNKGLGAISGSVLDILGDAAGPFINAVADKISNSSAVQKFATEGGGKNVLDAVGQASKMVSDWAGNHPEAAKQLGSLFSNAVVFGPELFGKGTAAEKPEEAKAPVAQDVSSEKAPASSRVETKIGNHFAESEDVIKETPEMVQKNGMGELLDRTKTNIVDDLKASGLKDEAAKISSLDPSKFNDLESFKAAVNDAVTPKQSLVPEGAKLYGGSPAGTTGKVLNVAEHALNPVPENVRTILTNPDTAEATKARLTELFTQGEKSIKEGGGTYSPLEKSGQENFTKANQTLKDKLTSAGQAKEAALAEVGSKTVSGVGQTTAKFSQGVEKRLGATFDVSEDGNTVLTNAPGRTSIITKPAEVKILSQVSDWIHSLGQNPTVQKVNDIVDRIQGEINYAAKGGEPINTKTQGLLKEVAHDLNENAKSAAGDIYRKANEDYSRVKQLFVDSSKAVGKNYSKVGNLMNQVFSRGGKGAKDLVTRIEQETGLPIFQDATLSKFVMEALNDPRAKGLIEEIKGLPTGSRNIAEKVIGYVIKQVTEPRKAAYRILENTINSVKKK